MAKGPTFNTITAAFASASKLNANFAAITTSLQNTVSRDGSTPNTMIADFDMNSNNILNVSSLDVDSLVLGGTAVTAGELPAVSETQALDTKATVAATSINTNFNFVRTAGLSAVGDGGDALYKRVGSEPSHALKVQSADGAWWEGVVPFMTPEMFGAVGDGVTDDLTKLQDMFDCTVSDTIIFGKGKTYFYETAGSADNLTITRPMHIQTNGSTLHHKVTGGSGNHALVIKTVMGAEETWTETISAYATVLTITSSLTVGTRIFIELGEHPNDATVDHVFLWATITANGGTTLTIDKPVPFAINGTSHSIYPIATPNEGTYIDVLRFVQEGNSVATLRLQSVRDFSLASLIVKDGTAALSQIDGCQNINVGSISGTGRDGGTSSTGGRVLSGWGGTTIRIGAIDWASTDIDGAVLFIEAGTTDVYIDQFNLKRVLASAGTTAVIKANGASQLRIGTFTLTSNKADKLLSTASTGSTVYVENLVLWTVINPSAFFSIRHVNRIQHLGTEYKDKVQLSKKVYVNENTTFDLEWFWGVPRRAFLRIDDKTKIQGISIKYEDDTTSGFLGDLTSGEWTDIGSSGPVNAEKAFDKGRRFRLRIDAAAASSALIETWVEYWRDPDVTELSQLASWDENRGEVTDTTDGSGDIVIAHGLQNEPRSVNIQMQGTTDYNTTITAKDGTNFTVRVWDAAGAAKTSTAVTVSWSAMV